MARQSEETSYIDWLKSRSMLRTYDGLVKSFAGQAKQWRASFGNPKPNEVLAENSVWFAAYPDSLMGPEGANVLDVLCDKNLYTILSDIGIEAVHTGPMKRSGSIHGYDYGESVDGHFDRMQNDIDPDYGNQEQYKRAVTTAHESGVIFIGDIVPGHTGKGPDFRLAERNEPGFVGLYAMIEIDPDHWGLLPEIKEGDDCANLSVSCALELKRLGYDLVGPFDVEVFRRPGVKETSWSATPVIEGVDGVKRRWAYLHIFKSGQPTLNWTDPSFAAHRLTMADILGSLHVLGVKGLRLDATMFLGVEARFDAEAGWLGGHPISNQVTDLVGMMIRKFGGFSFQELNIDLKKIKAALEFGPDFSYDFPTRPAYLYALATEDAAVLRLMLREMLAHNLSPARFVHGLQNHDELMLETTHLSVNGDEIFNYDHEGISGKELFRKIHETGTNATTGDNAPYNQVFAMNPGVCSTMAGFIAPALGVRDLDDITPAHIDRIKQKHLLAAAYNALQGGVFAISGWDLVGALPVSMESVADLVADRDARWINRGGYDLLGVAPDAQHSIQGLPRAKALYGDLPTQLEDPKSFVSLLRSLLSLRKAHGVERAELVSIPDTGHSGLAVMVSKLPGDGGDSESWLAAVLNFSGGSVVESLNLPNVSGGAVQRWNSYQGVESKHVAFDDNVMELELAPFEAQFILIS
ncbi:MAG: alpha-amylase family glycosyl hydrolase [Parvularculaceae bacterium]